MARAIAATLVKVSLLLDEHGPEEQEQAMAFLASRYGLPKVYADAIQVERRREQDRLRQAEALERARRHVTQENGLAEAHDEDIGKESHNVSRDSLVVHTRHVTPRNSHADIYVNDPVVPVTTPEELPASKKSKSPKSETVLEQQDLDKAKALLEAGDYEFLQACPEPFRTQWLGAPDWVVSLKDGYPGVDFQTQVSRYMAWPGARRKRDHRAALRNWVATADRWREREEQRKAVRR